MILNKQKRQKKTIGGGLAFCIRKDLQCKLIDFRDIYRKNRSIEVLRIKATYGIK